jgi:hypothetical protein
LDHIPYAKDREKRHSERVARTGERISRPPRCPAPSENPEAGREALATLRRWCACPVPSRAGHASSPAAGCATSPGCLSRRSPEHFR